MAALVPDERLGRLQHLDFFLELPNNLTFHSGPVAPPRTDDGEADSQVPEQLFIEFMEFGLSES